MDCLLYLPLASEAIAFNADHIAQRDFRPVRQDQHPLDRVQLFQPSGGGEIGPAVLPLIRLKPGDRNLWLFHNVLQQNRLPPVQLRFGILVQFYLLVRQPGSLRNGPCVAGESGDRG